MAETISVLVCTYRRMPQLALLLDDLAAQTRRPDEIVVVDNDQTGSAQATVTAFAARAPCPVRYEVQPLKNISITRNRTVALAGGDWFAFVDDDERTPPDWLERMLACALSHGVTGVQGPLVYRVPPEAPEWIRRADHYGMPRDPTGTVVTPNRTWINNALIRASAVRAVPGPFDEVFGLTGGEDSDMLARLLALGHTLIWCDEAVVTEPVHPSRLNLRWILLRAMRGGQDYATHWKRGLFGPAPWYAWAPFALRSAVQFTAASAAAVAVAPAGRHRSVPWLRRAAANAGKLSALIGWRYVEYAAPKTNPETAARSTTAKSSTP